MQGQTWNAERYKKNARFVSDLGMPVVELLAPRPGERILDLGCGDGVLTKKLADMGCVMVGVDASPELITAARKLDLDTRVMPGQNLTFENEYDAVLSNAALHWMKPPEAVIAGVYRALKLGGRFVAEFGGQGNVGAIVVALHDALAARGVDPKPVDPWYFPSAIDYRALLEKQGFAVKQIALHQRPTVLPGDIAGWLETFAGNFTAALPEEDRANYLKDVRERLKPPLFDATENRWTAPYIRLRFCAIKNQAKIFQA